MLWVVIGTAFAVLVLSYLFVFVGEFLCDPYKDEDWN